MPPTNNGGVLMSGEEFADMVERLSFETFHELAVKKTEGAKTIAEAAALCDVALIFTPPKDGKPMSWGFTSQSETKTVMIQLNPNLREQEQWEHFRFALALIYMRRKMPEMFGFPEDAA